MIEIFDEILQTVDSNNHFEILAFELKLQNKDNILYVYRHRKMYVRRRAKLLRRTRISTKMYIGKP